MTDFSAEFLAQRFPTTSDQFTHLEQRFNDSMCYAWERAVDFIKLHYCISDRTDSDFWLDNKMTETIPSTLQVRLNLWNNFVPITDDFFSHFEVFFLENYLFVLYGMHYKTIIADNPVETKNFVLNKLKEREEITSYLKEKLPNHRSLLDKINKFGLQSI